MRTTIQLPDDLHELARQLAYESNRSMGEVIADLIRNGIRKSPTELAESTRGLPVVRVGRPITAEDVRSLDDEE